LRIHIRNASVYLKGKYILEEVNFDIKDGDRVAIVGKNGAGKTTFLKALQDLSMFSDGILEEKFSVDTIGNFKIGYLKQIHFEDESISLIEEVKKSFKELFLMEDKLARLVCELEKNHSEKKILEYTELMDQYQRMGGYTYKKEYEVMIKKFGFKKSDYDKKLKEFSGGQKMKISFIKLLLSKPDLLLLDEPTNHLDIEAILWLEEYLNNYKGAVILVSHDRMFVNQVAQVIYEIFKGKMTRYVGDYDAYLEQKKMDYEKRLALFKAQEKEIEKLKTIYEKFRYKPSKAGLAMSRLHRLEKMQLLDKPSKDEKSFGAFKWKNEKNTSDKIVQLKNVAIGYQIKLATFNLEILKGMKIGILGENGCGKSTFLKTLNQSILPLKGKIIWGTNLEIGYFDQNLEMIDDNYSILEEFRSAYPDFSLEESRRILGSFLFKQDDVFKKVSVLSGGERVRLQLCKIFCKQPNLLILDEVTNHLDIAGKECLEEILKDYKGTLVFVTHDRYFLKKVATSLLYFHEDKVEFYPYGYEDYLEKNKENKNKIKNEETIKKTKKEPDQQRVIKRLENDITSLENRIKELREESYKEEVYLDSEKIKLVEEQIANYNNLLKEKYDEWTALMEG